MMKMNVDKILFDLKTTNFDPTKICVSTISVCNVIVSLFNNSYLKNCFSVKVHKD